MSSPSHKGKGKALPHAEPRDTKVKKGVSISKLTPENVKENPFRFEKTLDDFEGYYIASGSPGTVVVCVNKVHPNDKEKKPYSVACKNISKHDFSKKKNSDVSEIFTEVNIGMAANHRNVLKVLECIETPTDYYIFTPLYGDNLFDWLLRGYYDDEEEQIITIAKQLLEGLKYLHDHNIVHRDIKHVNILFYNEDRHSSSGLDLNPLSVVISDLGSAAVMKDGKAEGLTGTPYFHPPEVLSSIPYNEKADIWSLGVTLYYTFTFAYPFDGDDASAIVDATLNKDVTFPNYTWKDKPNAVDFINLCLTKDPSKRPSAKTLLSHKWIKSLKGPVAGISENFNASTKWKNVAAALKARSLLDKKMRQDDIGKIVAGFKKQRESSPKKGQGKKKNTTQDGGSKRRGSSPKNKPEGTKKTKI